MGRTPFRRLEVLVDAPVVDDLNPAPWRPELLVAGFLGHNLITCLRYADDGPPASAPREQVATAGEVVPGWAVLVPVEPAKGVWHVRSGGAKHLGITGIMGNRTQVAAEDKRTNAYRDVAPAAAAERRTRDALAAQVADALSADVFVTDRPYLHAVEWQLARGITILDAARALSLISLYLRSQGVYLINRAPDGSATLELNRGLFFWVGALELLPAAWRWFNGCGQYAKAQGDDALQLLAQSALMRVSRALQVRDRLHVALNQPQNNDIADDALSALDLILMLLMGAFDATARVVHHILGISGSSHNAGWQHSAWLKKVAKASPNLGQLLAVGSAEANAVTILTILRNSVHGEALQPLAARKGAKPQQTLVGVPTEKAKDLLAAVAELGGMESWGLEELIPGRFHADPGILLERLLPLLVNVMNAIMKRTPVDSLSGVHLEPASLLPPATEPFDERTRLSIRWQLGF